MRLLRNLQQKGLHTQTLWWFHQSCDQAKECAAPQKASFCVPSYNWSKCVRAYPQQPIIPPPPPLVELPLEPSKNESSATGVAKLCQ